MHLHNVWPQTTAGQQELSAPARWSPCPDGRAQPWRRPQCRHWSLWPSARADSAAWTPASGCPPHPLHRQDFTHIHLYSNLSFALMSLKAAPHLLLTGIMLIHKHVKITYVWQSFSCPCKMCKVATCLAPKSLCALLMTCCCPRRRPLHSCQHLLSGVLSHSLSLVLTRSTDPDYILSTKAHLHSMELNFKQTIKAMFFIFVGRPNDICQHCQFYTLFSEQHLSILHPVFRATPVSSAPCFQSNTCQLCTLFSEQHLSILHHFQNNTCQFCTLFSEHLSVLHPVFRTTPVNSAPCFQNTCQFYILFSEHLSILHPVFRTTPVNSAPCFQNTCQFYTVFRTTPVNSAPCFQNTCQFYTLFSEQHLSILHPVFRTTPINYAPCFFFCVCVQVSWFGLAVRLVSGRTLVWYHFSSPFSSKRLWSVDTVLWLCPSLSLKH